MRDARSCPPPGSPVGGTSAILPLLHPHPTPPATPPSSPPPTFSRLDAARAAARIHTLPPPPRRTQCPLLPVLVASFRRRRITSTTTPPPGIHRCRSPLHGRLHFDRPAACMGHRRGALHRPAFSTTPARCSTFRPQGTIDSGDEFFFNNFMCSSDDSSSDDDDFVVATMVVSDHIARQRPSFSGSIPGHAPTLESQQRDRPLPTLRRLLSVHLPTL